MHKRFWVVAAILLASTRGLAQENALTSPPPNIIVPNYNGIPTGPLGGLEGSAHIARAADTSAPWFNPAGLSQAGSQLSGSVGNYQFTTVTPKRLPNTGGSTQHLPNLAGGTFKFKDFTLGFALITTVAWGSNLDSLYTLTNADGNPERFAYSADSRMSQRVTAGAIGYDVGKHFRVGGGLALTATSINSEQIISDRIATPGGNRTLLFAVSAHGSVDALRGVFGVQYQPNSLIRIGLMTRTPGIRYGKGGSLTLDSTADGGGPSLGAAIYDSSASFDYKLPYELSGGVAIVKPRAEVEFDIKHYTSIDPYALLASNEALTIYSDPGDGTRGSASDKPFPAIMTSARAVTNYTTGGHVQIFKSIPVSLHAGFGTDHSPVPSLDSAVFGQVDFNVFTAGVSGAVKTFKFAFGVNSRRGQIDNLVLENLLTGPVQASLKIKTIGITYSINYKF